MTGENQSLLPDNSAALVNPGDAEAALELPIAEDKPVEKPTGEEETTDEEIDEGEEKPEGEKPKGESETEVEDDVQEWAKDNEIKLPERVKTQKDLVAYLKEADQKPTDERITRLEKILAKQGLNVEGFLEQAERYQPQAAAEDTTKAPVMMTVADVMKEFATIHGEDAYSNPNLLLKATDDVNKHNMAIVGQEITRLRNEINGLKQTAGSIASYTDQGLYEKYKATYKDGALTKPELDRYRAKDPDMTYDQAHAYHLAKNPESFRKLMDSIVKNEIDKRDKAVGKEKRSLKLRADGRIAGGGTRRAADYLAPGGGWLPKFYTELTSDERVKMSEEALRLSR